MKYDTQKIKYKGKNNPHYISNSKTRNKCKCGKHIGFYAKRCWKCYVKWRQDPKTNPNWKGGKPEIKCSFCNKKTHKKLYQLKRSKNLFCSKKCHDKYTKELFKNPKNNPMFGKRGKETGNYIHGNGYEPYAKTFTESLKEQIRNRDGNKCIICGMTKREHLKKYKRNLEVHHKDHNKKNCKKSNLETRCKKCNLNDNFK